MNLQELAGVHEKVYRSEEFVKRGREKRFLPSFYRETPTRRALYERGEEKFRRTSVRKTGVSAVDQKGSVPCRSCRFLTAKHAKVCRVFFLLVHAVPVVPLFAVHKILS